ncbi:MAG: hypothetical protein WDW36_001997 [Sanguina aurantia]
MTERPTVFSFFEQVYGAAEALFAQLAEELKRWADWVVLGTIQDLDEYADSNLTEVADWELNFRMLKAAAKDCEKLPNELKVDCYKVSLGPVKASVEEQMKKLQDTLVASLRRKAVAEKEEVEDFMKGCGSLFTKSASSVEDIGVAGQEAKGMVEQLAAVGQVRRRIEEKNRLLRQMAGSGREAFAVVELGDVNNRWEAFTTQLQQFDAHLEEQKAGLQVQIVKQLDEFRGKVAGFASRWAELKPKGGPSGNPALVLQRIEEYSAAIQDLREESAKLQKEAGAFKIEASDFDMLAEVAEDVAATKVSWDRYGAFLAERDEMANKDWLSMRDQVWKIEDFLAKWSKASMGRGSDDPIAIILLHEIEAYTRCLPHLKSSMRGAGWEETHWLQLFHMLGFKTSGPNAITKENVTLAHFLDKADALVKNAEAIKSLDAQAQGESVLRKALSELKMWGLTREFSLSESTSTSHGKVRKTSLIKEWRDVMTEVGDNQSLVASLRGSSFYNMFKDEISTWEGKLSFLQEGMGLLNQIQRKWVYLEPIFGRGALPAQQQRFRNVDEEFRRVMSTLEMTKKVVAFADIPGIRDKLPQMAQQLDVCQRALADFLEDKRSQFPRFYFLGDDDLLEILGQAKNPAVIQSHLKKLFAGIHKVKFSADQTAISSMISMETETVEFSSAVNVTEAVEQWLRDLNLGMKGTLQGQLEMVRAGKLAREFEAAASQTLCLKEAVSWTENTEAGIRGGPAALAKLLKDTREQLSQLTASDYTSVALLQLKKQALVLDFIHYLDVVEHLIAQKTTKVTEWAWTRQLRYYHRGEGSVGVSMAEAQFDYSWEYQGNAPKLVYTPLTDKCYLTLTQGMALGYGGNPYGPAGTGKTESVKALGQAMARQVLVFNCDEEFDFKSMGRIFVGLVKCGAWGCFDEFNRLDEEVLSAVSQQIQIIQGALKEKATSMMFLEKQVEVDKNAGIFVTLNPAGKGYGGRSKLPDNLKQLFRSIAMSVPDNELIGEVLLLSEGFSTAKELSRKLVSLFTLSRELLSPQQHYDWGLRALKTSLGIAGRELRDARRAGTVIDAVVETEIIIRAVAATKLPTLTFEDNGRFRALLGDLFPGANITDAQNAELEAALRESAQAMDLDLTRQQVDKMLQLHLACQQRIGVIIVGPSGSGKSTLWEVLEKAYERLGRRPVVYKMNPKAMARQQLLGSMNLDTREWSDGVLTAAARKVVKEPLEQRSWIICDGDVDPEWIESLNSVLDDNRLLTMPNGERIQFANNINFIFECHSLEFASPATVSRCGMLFMSDEAMDIDRMVGKWMRAQAARTGLDTGLLAGWFASYFGKAFAWVLAHPRAVETTKGGCLDAALSHLAMGASTKFEFVSALARGLGSNMTTEVRADFMTDLARLTSEVNLLNPSCPDPLYILGDDLRDGGMDEDAADSLVITPEVAQNLALLAPWLKNREPFILVGPEGAGKSTLLEHCFKRLAGVHVATVNCSAQTSAANVVQKLVQVCGKPVTTNSGKCLRPPDNGRIILYLRDINLPRPDKYNTSQLVAFLQQLLTHQGYYDDNLEFIKVERIQIVGIMNPASTVGRHALSTRFTARVRVAYVTHPDTESLAMVYTNMATKVLGSSSGSGATPAALARAMLEVYGQVKEAFSLNDHQHYQFNPRDVTDWMLGLQRYALDSMTLLEAVWHEGCRTFHDRLVGRDAREQCTGIVTGVLSGALGYRGQAAPWVASTLGASSEDRLNGDPSRLRLAKWSLDTFGELVAEKLKGYERETKELGLLLFPEVLEKVARYDRVLAQPGGSLLLCGSSGVGRRSLMLLLAYMHHMELVTPKMTRSYDMKAFRNDLKAVLLTSGVEGKPVLLLLEDHQLVQPAFLELINSLLSGGEVPGLFTPEELAKELAPLGRARDDDPTYSGPPSSYAYFIHRVQKHLHVAVSMDPSNEEFRQRCESNPALFTRCDIQWLDGWSTQGMVHISSLKLEAIFSGSSELTANASAQLVDHMLHLHNNSGVEPTPRQYIAFVNLYGAIYQKQREQVLTQQSFLKGGLSKLAEAASTVDTLSRAADKQKTLLGAKSAEADVALKQIQVSMSIAAERGKEVEALRKRTGLEEGQMKNRRGSVESELAKVQPMIDAARKAVGNIRKENIDEIRSLKMPPDAIRDVLEGVLLILGQDDTSWNNMKKFLGGRGVKDDIINYDAHNITPTIRAKVDKLLESKGRSFEPAVIARVSVAAAPLATWVSANMAYSQVLEKVFPLESELNKLLSSLGESTGLIAKFEAELVQLNKQVEELNQNFQSKTGEAQALKFSVDKAEATLTAARSLLEKLGGEKGRWERTVKEQTTQLKELPLASLVAAAFTTYLPSFSEDTRASIMKGWLLHLSMPEFDITRFLSSESIMLGWKTEGMPADQLSMQNGVVILESRRSPLMIDPSAQASEWLKNHLNSPELSGNAVEVTTMHDPRFTTALELAVRFGKTLIVAEVDRIEPILFPLLRMDLDRQGPRFVVQIGDKAIDYNDTFRIFLVTRNPHPQLSPDARSLLAVTNFTVTRSGLEGQLLGMTLQKEQPELEGQKSELLKAEEDLKMNLDKLEKSLLKNLANSTGNILDNKELLDSLNSTKAESITIAVKLQEAVKLTASLDQQREVYRPVAARGSMMFFTLRDLAAVNHMYQFSLAVFLSLFKRALSETSRAADVPSRIAMLNDKLLKLAFPYISRSLFNADRQTFGMHMARHLNPDMFKGAEWGFFLEKALPVTEAGSAKRSPSWVREESRPAYEALNTAFPAVVKAANLQDAAIWSPWATGAGDSNGGSEAASLVPAGAHVANPFHQLMLVKAFRPDKLQQAMSSFICSVLHVSSVAPPPFSLKTLLEGESSADVPILFITTPGADPSQELSEYAQSSKMMEQYHEVAMGQGQAEKALTLLRACAREGGWLVLKNVHLAVSWLPTLEKELYTLSKHENFRLFLTSEPHDKFPTTLLEGSLKVTFEAPPGLKKNLLRTYEAWSQEYIAEGTPLRAQLLFILAWFNAVVQERRTYIPQGWTKFYEFSFADLRSAMDVVNLATRGKDAQWQLLHGLLENAIYGGRLESVYDEKVLSTYLSEFFNKELVGGGKVRPLLGSKTVLPTSTHRADYLAIISSLPDSDAPALFGLPPNIDRTVQQINSQAVMASLKSMSLLKDSAGGFQKALWSKQLDPLLRLWSVLMGQHTELKKAAKEIRASVAKADATPLDNFVSLERLHGATLVATIDRTLGALARVLKGKDTLTSSVQKSGAALMSDAVPAAWDTMWEGPESPLDYCRAVVNKAAAIEAWNAKCQAKALLTGGPLDLSHLFHPGTFLNALRQQSARTLKQPMDALKLATCWDVSRLGGEGITVVQLGGLLLQGAIFEGNRLGAVSPDAPSVRRSKLLTAVQLPVGNAEEASTWVLAGLALFLPGSV